MLYSLLALLTFSLMSPGHTFTLSSSPPPTHPNKHRPHHHNLRLFAHLPSDLLTTIAVQASVGSAVYSALTFYYDRPRGEMLVPTEAVDVRASTIPNAGLGLFAARDLRAGQNLGLYPGVLVGTGSYRSTKLEKYPASVSYVWKLQNERGVIDPTDEVGNIHDVCRGGSSTIPLSRFLFTTLFSFATKPTALCRINEPLSAAEANVESTEDSEAGKVLFFLSRDVSAGEELFIDYGPFYDRSAYESQPPI